MKRKLAVVVSTLTLVTAAGVLAAGSASAATPAGGLTVYSPKTQSICVGLLNPDGTQHPLICINLPDL